MICCAKCAEGPRGYMRQQSGRWYHEECEPLLQVQQGVVYATPDPEVRRLRAELATKETELNGYHTLLADRDAEIARLKTELSDQQLNGEALRLIREALDGVGISSAFAIDLGEMAAAEIARLRAERGTIIAAFRVNMMRQPRYSHAAFDQRIAEILAQPLSPPPTEAPDAL